MPTMRLGQTVSNSIARMPAKTLERQWANMCITHGPRHGLVHWPSPYLQAGPSRYKPEINNTLFMGYTLKKVAGQDVAPVHWPSCICKLGPSAMKRLATLLKGRLAKPYNARLAKPFYTLIGRELLARYLRPCVKYGWPVMYVKVWLNHVPH